MTYFITDRVPRVLFALFCMPEVLALQSAEMRMVLLSVYVKARLKA